MLKKIYVRLKRLLKKLLRSQDTPALQDVSALQDTPVLQDSIKAISESGLFDSEYYLENNPDVVAARSNPLEHFLVCGGKEGRNPSKFFNTNYYLENNPDVATADINPLLHYIYFGKKEGRLPQSSADVLKTYGSFDRMDIVTTKHTYFVAELFKRCLEKIDICCEIHIGEPEQYSNIPYIIICPQFVEKFPTVYWAVQMEQTVSSRWLTPEYYSVLENALGVIDYSVENIKYFKSIKTLNFGKKVFYIPIDYCKDYRNLPSENKEYDVIFYGDANSCQRRRDILNRLSQKYKVKVISEVFGDDVYREIAKAKILINLHYYEGALLETTRLYETLSLNSCVIVSEASTDPTEDEKLAGIVDFVPVGDVEQMENRIDYWLNNPEMLNQRIQESKKHFESKTTAFEFFFYRFLLDVGRIGFDEFYELSGNYIQFNGNKICLGLPEDKARADEFAKENKYGFQMFPGLRFSPGWIGCAMSYKYIFKKALETDFEYITVCEDDVVFPSDFDENIGKVYAFLELNPKWDLFSGLMADVDTAALSGYERRDGLLYVRINHMVSTVFNIYHRGIFKALSEWDPENDDVYSNTIDRYMEKKRLVIWLTLPFLVGHKEELQSTLWNGKNTRYTKMIANAEYQLFNKLESFEKLSVSKEINEKLSLLLKNTTLSDKKD